MLGYEFVIILFMLLFNAVFAAYEMGLASVTKARLLVLLSEKKKGASDALYMKERMEASLTMIQLGLTIVGALAAATGGLGVGEKLAPYLQKTFTMPELLSKILSIVFFIIPLTAVIMIFGELVPKVIALNNKELIVLRVSPFMKVISKIFDPIISIIEAVVKKIVRLFVMFNPKELSSREQDLHELKVAVSLARTAKILGAREERIVLSAASFSFRIVKDIVIPVSDISTLYMNDNLTQALVKAHLDMHTRFPVCTKENDPQTIEGYVNFKDIITALRVSHQSPSIKQITRPIKKVPEDMVLSSLLETMIQEKIHIVLVVSSTGKNIGMVTLEDIIEELTGDIEDEFDRLPGHIHPYGESWIMGGGVLMTTVASTLGLNWETKFFHKGELASGERETKIPTLSEWCRKFQKELANGEIIEKDGLRIAPRKFRRKKLSEAIISLVQNPKNHAN